MPRGVPCSTDDHNAGIVGICYVLCEFRLESPVPTHVNDSCVARCVLDCLSNHVEITEIDRKRKNPCPDRGESVSDNTRDAFAVVIRKRTEDACNVSSVSEPIVMVG